MGTRTYYPNDAPAYTLVDRVKWDCPPEAIEEAAQMVEAAFRSAPAQTISAALFRLRTLTRSREQRTAEMQEAEAIIWIENLQKFPGDIVMKALIDWPSRPSGQWWPTWHEFEAVLAQATDRRRAILRHLASLADKPAELPEPPGPTPEERAAIVEKWQQGGRLELSARDVPTKPVEPPEEALERLRLKNSEEPVVMSHELAQKLRGGR